MPTSTNTAAAGAPMQARERQGSGCQRLGTISSHLHPSVATAGDDADDSEEEAAVRRELLGMVNSLDAGTYRDNRMTAAEREFYDREGYLIIPDAIESAADVQELKELLGRVRETSLRGVASASHRRLNSAAFSQRNSPMFSGSDAMVRLLTTPRVFPKVVDALGWNISLYHVHLNTVPPQEGEGRGGAAEEGAQRPPAPAWESAPTLGFHQDSGRGARPQQSIQPPGHRCGR